MNKIKQAVPLLIVIAIFGLMVTNFTAADTILQWIGNIVFLAALVFIVRMIIRGRSVSFRQKA